MILKVSSASSGDAAMKILLVEDDALLSTALADLLRKNGYAIDLADNGKTWFDLAMSAEYDLIVLDWLIPQLDGITLCEQLRSQGYSQPILLLTTNNSQTDIVAGLDAGADDYVIKPYNPEALLAKIRSLLRRSGAVYSSKLTWQNLCLDQVSGKVTCDEQIISLTATEYKLLELFLQNPNRIFSRRVILDRLWGFNDAPIENAVTTHIKDLRKKLKTGGFIPDILETVYGMGYRLKPEAENYPVTQVTTGEQQDKPQTKDLASVNRVLAKFHDSFGQQVAVLEQAKTALLADKLHPELQQQAQQEAHKLAGSMGAFGYPQGSRLAQELENTEIFQIARVLPASTPTDAKVLIVDDDPVMLANLSALLTTWGIEVTTLPQPQQFWKVLTATSPDLVVLDLEMPIVNGLELCQVVRQDAYWGDLPILVVTAHTDAESLQQAFASGADDFISKSVLGPELVTRVLSRIERRRSHHHSYQRSHTN
jgi:DNA-binding response OmpR family regulator/HPt (histidine-containing phosphotransfer) domain-containing protein